MAKHRKRMRSIFQYNNPLLRTMAEEDILKIGEDPGYKAQIKKAWKRANAIIEAQSKNGAGFLTDETLRYFLYEYNNRNFQYGLDSMPSSFNVMEAFFEHRPDLAFFKLRDEKDHLFSMTEFIDFVTKPDQEMDFREALNYLEEGKTYSYGVLSKVEDFIFSSDDGCQYGIVGVSMVRHGTEVSMLLIAGEKTDLTEASETLNSIQDGTPITGKQNIKPCEDLKREVVCLEDTSEFWKTVVLTRFDFADATQDVRYVLRDCGDSFDIITDDINAFIDNTGTITPELEKAFKQCNERLKPYGILLDVCKTMLLLPSYFWVNGELVSNERHNTELFSEIHKVQWRTKKKSLGSKENIGQRVVAVLKEAERLSPDRVSYNAPEFKMERSGYWKKLSPHKVGKDKQGRDIHGRTWVQQTLSWIEEEAVKNVVTVTNNKSLSMVDNPNKGCIYVMRSASDKKDIYKIGLTRRSPETRAGEVSSGTGVPTKYLVVEEWEVADCVQAEAIIHRELDKYRINDRREFFLVSYKEARKVIESIVDVINDAKAD